MSLTHAQNVTYHPMTLNIYSPANPTDLELIDLWKRPKRTAGFLKLEEEVDKET